MALAATDSLSLAEKVAIVTGSGRENGIGAGIALALAKAGARVTVNFVSESTASRAAEVVSKIEGVVGNDRVIAVQADVSTAGGAKALVRETLKRFNVDHIDILVNNAFWTKGGPALEVSPEDVAKSFGVTVFGTLFMIQAVVPHMPRGGRVVNIGSIGSKTGFHETPVYNATKAANDALTFSMASEASALGRDRGITINTIAPGPVITDSMPQENAKVKWITDYHVDLTRADARVGTHEDIADVVLFIASEKSRWITGQWLSVSGGIVN